MKRLRTSTVTPTAPMFLLAAMFVAAGGFVHLRAWFDLYRHLPAGSPGASVVQIGFPINAAVSLLAAAALVLCAWRRSRFASFVVGATVIFQLASLGVLIATRRGTVLGWAEPSWAGAAGLSRAVEIGALITLAAIAALATQGRLRNRGQVAVVESR